MGGFETFPFSSLYLDNQLKKCQSIKQVLKILKI